MTFSTTPLGRDASGFLVAAVICLAACESSVRGRGVDSVAGRDTTRVGRAGILADTLAIECPATGQRGSVLVARPDPKEEESLVSFAVLGDGVGPGVVLCRGVLYADVAALLKLMGEHAIVSAGTGRAVIDSTVTEIPAYRHDGEIYVAVQPFARQRRALWAPSDHPQDGTIWPQETLQHLKAVGRTGGIWQTALREGLVRN